MITRIFINNFKSLLEFNLPPEGHELGPFTCLIGLNGAGKSTLLQALDFIAQVATGNITSWLERREWKKADLGNNLGLRKPLIMFIIELRTAQGNKVEWHARFNISLLRCTVEAITYDGATVLKVEDGKLSLSGANLSTELRSEKLSFEYQGSVLSSLKIADAHPAIKEVKNALADLKSLELLSPQAIRRRAKKAEDIGAGGEKLSAFLSGFTPAQKEALTNQLKDFYPTFQNLQVNTLRYGWKNLKVSESYSPHSGIDATHLNDGLLRIIAILSQAQSNHKFLLFDEIENGINPSLVGKLMDFLVHLGDLGKQVIVTTHSPIILNYLDDSVAKEGVMLLFKTEDGRTQVCRYFDLPETGYKLKALGPGEVFVDTDLNKLVTRLVAENNALGIEEGA
jgi:predicted ATPase